MTKALGAAMLAVGVILLFFGYNASESLSSEVSEALTGSPSDQAMWYLIGGTACAVFGLVTLIASSRK